MNSLTLLSNASKMLAEVKTLDEAKDLMDMAAAAKLYAKKHNLGKEAVGHAMEIETRSERKLGEILDLMDMNKGVEGQLQGKDSSGSPLEVPPENNLPTLAEIGITKNLSSEAQTLAQVEEEVFEKVATGKKSKKSVVKEIRQKKRNKKLQEKAPELPTDIFQVVYCDPPWQYRNSGLNGSAESKYPCKRAEKNMCGNGSKSIGNNAKGGEQ